MKPSQLHYMRGSKQRYCECVEVKRPGEAMTSQSIDIIEPESIEGQQVRGVRGVLWLLGFSGRKAVSTNPEAGRSPVTRPCRVGRKRIRWASRLLMAILPRRIQGLLGYPVCTSIGYALSPEVCDSPTKPCGKGSKRKQDDLDEDNEPEQQSWVEALTQEMGNEESAGDPDYEPSAFETDSEEYKSHNDTESDLEMQGGVVVIRDLEMGVPPEA